MWYPNKTQWSVIWAFTVVALVLWLNHNPDPESLVAPGALIAALFTWQVSQGGKSSPEL